MASNQILDMVIKNKEELSSIKTAAAINTDCIHYLRSITEVGISGLELDAKAEEFYKKHNVKPAFKGIYGYPSTINFMLDDQVVHCIPNKYQIVKDGSIISIDTGCIYKGFFADQAISFGIGEMSEEDTRLINTARMSIEAGCAQCVSSKNVGDIGYAQQSVIEMAGFSVVREFVGHEIGKSLHDPLKIPGYGKKNSGPKLRENMVVCIENQVCAGSNAIYIDRDGWSTYTQDGRKSATFEHMVIIGSKSPTILTKF